MVAIIFKKTFYEKIKGYHQDKKSPDRSHTVKFGYYKYSRETEIGSIQRGFVISERLSTQIKSKGDENQSDIAAGNSLYPVSDIAELDCITV